MFLLASNVFRVAMRKGIPCFDLGFCEESLRCACMLCCVYVKGPKELMLGARIHMTFVSYDMQRTFSLCGVGDEVISVCVLKKKTRVFSRKHPIRIRYCRFATRDSGIHLLNESNLQNAIVVSVVFWSC